MLRAGRLKERITLERPEQVKGRGGGVVRNWVLVVDSLPAARTDFSGNEKPATAQAGGQVAVARTEFLIRWMPGVDATMRILHEGQIHNIRHIKPLGRRESLVLTCDTGGNDG